MSSPKDLPKIEANLKSELESAHNLKPTDTREKVLLPSSEQIQREKDEKNLLSSIESFENKNLKKTEVIEKNPLPTKEIIEQEKNN